MTKMVIFLKLENKMKKKKSTEDFMKILEEGIESTNIVLDREAKVITREDNGRVIAILDKTLNQK